MKDLVHVAIIEEKAGKKRIDDIREFYSETAETQARKFVEAYNEAGGDTYAKIMSKREK